MRASVSKAAGGFGFLQCLLALHQRLVSVLTLASILGVRSG